MDRFIPHAVFGAAYLLISVACAALLDAATGSDHPSAQHLVGPIVAPVALMIAERFGALSLPGVLVTALLVMFVAYVFTFAILYSIAAPVSGSISFLALVNSYFAVIEQAGWPFVLGNALSVLSPVVWLHLLRGPKLATGGAA